MHEQLHVCDYEGHGFAATRLAAAGAAAASSSLLPAPAPANATGPEPGEDEDAPTSLLPNWPPPNQPKRKRSSSPLPPPPPPFPRPRNRPHRSPPPPPSLPPAKASPLRRRDASPLRRRGRSALRRPHPGAPPLRQEVDLLPQRRALHVTFYTAGYATLSAIYDTRGHEEAWNDLERAAHKRVTDQEAHRVVVNAFETVGKTMDHVINCVPLHDPHRWSFHLGFHAHVMAGIMTQAFKR